MGRRASSDRDRGNVAWRWALRAGDPERVAPAAAGLHGDGGKKGAAAGHVVGERGRAEADLACAASIVESSGDAVIGETLDGIITLWNAGAERLYGYKAHEVIGWPIALIIPRELDAELPTILDRIARGEHPDQYETVRVTRDGRRLDVSITMSPIRDPEGRVIGASAITRDMTHRKQAEATVRERDALRCVASLTAAAAHEINDPLAAAMPSSWPTRVSATGRKRIDEMLEALSRIQKIVARMQRGTRIELTDEAPYLPRCLARLLGSRPPTQEEALMDHSMYHFKVGEVVARRLSPNAIHGSVVRVTDNGYFVTVQWSDRVGPQGRESTHRPDDLVRVTD